MSAPCVRAAVCVSQMQVPQRSINFGSCEPLEPLQKSIFVHNLSAAPLMYRVAKTGRHASFDVTIERSDRLGCVRPYGSRQIRFLFKPSLAGSFRETLTVHNVQDAKNVVQVVVNAYVAYAIAHAVGGWVFGLGVRESPAVRHGVYLHYLCKYLDMLDTVIIVLRKKREQLSFLHLYHHSSIVVVWGWVVHTWPADASAVYCYGAWINACVHVVMYFYYGLTAVGYRPPPAFKRGVTVFQPPCTYKCTPSSRPW